MASSLPAACLNCGAALTGAYCARCGQKATRPDLTLGGFLHETTHELAHWDGKVPATLKTLFLKPGQLTIDFLAGRRARWLSPLRVYLICSVAFFGGRLVLEEMGLRTLRDIGAAGALVERNRSLLPAGVVRVEGSFARGDVVAIVTSAGQVVARGLTNYSASDLDQIRGRKTADVRAMLKERAYDEVVHRDNLVLA